ncbi:hypothetical protein D3C72_1298830 [compost metagenome]
MGAQGAGAAYGIERYPGQQQALVGTLQLQQGIGIERGAYRAIAHPLLGTAHRGQGQQRQ